MFKMEFPTRIFSKLLNSTLLKKEREDNDSTD